MKEQLVELLEDHRANLAAPIDAESYKYLYESLLNSLLEIEREYIK